MIGKKRGRKDKIRLNGEKGGMKEGCIKGEGNNVGSKKEVREGNLEK